MLNAKNYQIGDLTNLPVRVSSHNYLSSYQEERCIRNSSVEKDAIGFLEEER